MAKVWLITGSGNGLGRDIAEAALAAGVTEAHDACLDARVGHCTSEVLQTGQEG
jgi:NAD(P)-dependent dehydrogenase (short-subunit alcohol dehydrogenase family)